jgi:hypothetical protein
MDEIMKELEVLRATFSVAKRDGLPSPDVVLFLISCLSRLYI